MYVHIFFWGRGCEPRYYDCAYNVPTFYVLSLSDICPKDIKHLESLYIVEMYLFLIGCFFSCIYILEILTFFAYVLIFVSRTFWLILCVLTVGKFVKFLKRSMEDTWLGETGILFSSPLIWLIYASIWMNLSQYAYGCCASQRRVQLHSSKTQTTLLVNYISLLCH